MLEIVLWVWGSIATLGTIAAAIVRVRSSSDETVTQLWKDEAAAYKAKSERLETMLNDLVKRVEILESENRTLRDMHDNREAMLALRVAITEGFSDLKAILRENR